MAKRFIGTDIWQQDWFLDMPNEYKLFWNYILSECDHMGFFKVNIRTFSSVIEYQINTNKALEYFNIDKKRVREIKTNLWFIEDFICFQYGPNLNPKNRVHDSILKGLALNDIDIKSIRGLNEVNLGSIRPLNDPKEGVKDKDKDKEKDKDIVKVIKGGLEKKSQPNKFFDTYPFFTPEFELVWMDFIDMRKKKRKPLTERAIILNLNVIGRLSNGKVDLAIRICEQTIMRGWDGFFELKTDDFVKSTASKNFVIGQKHNAAG